MASRSRWATLAATGLALGACAVPAAQAAAPVRGATYVGSAGGQSQVRVTVSRDGKRVYDMEGHGIPGKCPDGPQELSFTSDVQSEATAISGKGTFRRYVDGDAQVKIKGTFGRGGRLRGRIDYVDRGGCGTDRAFTAVAQPRQRGSARPVFDLANGYGARRTKGVRAATAFALQPVGVAELPDGRLVVSDPEDATSAPDPHIRTIDRAGRIGTLLAPSSGIGLPGDLDVLRDGSVVFSQPEENCVRRRSPTGALSVVAGVCRSGDAGAGYAGDGGPAVAALLSSPRQVSVTPGGGFLVTDGGLGGEFADNTRVRRVAPDGKITTAVTLPRAVDVAALSDGGFLVSTGSQVLRVSASGALSTVAGSGSERFSGDNGPATKAGMLPGALAAMPGGGFVFADASVDRIRRVSATGRITSLAGGGEVFTGIPAGRAAFRFLTGSLAVLRDGSIVLDDESTLKLIPGRASHRLLVGLPARETTYTRLVLGRRAVPVTLSRAGTVRLRVTRGKRTVFSVKRRLRAGRSRVRLPRRAGRLRGKGTLRLRVAASSGAAVATDGMTLY